MARWTATCGQRADTSPYETDARVGCKGNQTWLGYRTHLTETCEADLPEVIVQVQTTPAPINDVDQLQPIQQDLLKQGLRPREQLVDGGDLESEQMLAMRSWASRCMARP